ncbi:MAG: cell wall-binding repeat-containing protein [Oscillospiraceae bacterium]|nr:cell wall-binding repeat-containing protein [Oscillospiraceae bacterium]
MTRDTTKVSGLSGVTAISVGYGCAFALKSDGTAWAWGNNDFGQLGDGTTVSRKTPVQVSGISDVKAIKGGTYELSHTVAMKADGTVWAWGNNTYGQLGSGFFSSSKKPVQVEKNLNLLYSYKIDLDKSGTVALSSAVQGYTETTPLTVTVKNSGTHSTGALKVTIADVGLPLKNFALSKTSLPSIGVNGSESFTITPKTGLAKGVYKADVTVSGNEGIEASFTVSFTVMPIPFERFSGATRIDTANAIATQGWSEGAETVVLASSKSFPDSLAGGPLAYALNAPLLLTANNDTLEVAVLDTIKNLKAAKVVIIGGVSSVKEEFKTFLEGEGLDVERVSGATRYETAVEIAQKLDEEGGEFKTVFLADGTNFPDALAGSPVAALEGQPILFTRARDIFLRTETAQYIDEIEAEKVVILGGTGSVATEVENSLKAEYGVETVERLSGDDRYETAVSIYRAYKGIFTSDAITVTTGTNFPDALAGGAFSAKIGAPLFLVGTRLLYSSSIRFAIRGVDIQKIFIYGGTSSLSDELIYKAVFG